ncbi:AMP-dependent synthetase/ligase [Neofusicoccum parvum]|uniref:AMP-dependent synthetase/ligase n=1 Tax=Neofusicoccum parvum TaxID=310453 RepID=A0ACB5S9C3_9PEZI|nr:AMP-dependent synthetase/ligase [Neofusicoccum parvum]
MLPLRPARLPIAAAAAGAAGLAAYLNAKFHIAHDLGNELIPPLTAVYALTRTYKKRLLNYHVLEEQAQRQPDRPFLVFDAAAASRRDWTYAQFLADVRKVANWLRNDLGVAVREVVALDGQNSPEYMLLWFALDAIGAVPSFINCNLTSKALVHCLCECRYLLCDAETKPLVEPHAAELDGAGVRTIYYSPDLAPSLSDATPIPASVTASLEGGDLRSLIYTSGTTGLPKATQISTLRDLITGHTVAYSLGLTSSTRMYTCMPLYHIAAHGLCTLAVLHAGGTVVLGRRFSHRSFWPEVVAGEATVVQYVGELCRYLMNAPPSPLDRAHRVDTAWGNGMRPDIWEPFRRRFGIERVAELYGATDGLQGMVNQNRGDFTKHAICLRGALWRLRNRSRTAIVKVDNDAGDEVVRGPDGWAIRCADGEPGEVLHRMDQSMPNDGFAGYYRNPAAGQKRKLADVFEKGDLWFRSGDMLRLDPEGRLYFVDRLGDTFRWKAENVSTNEVSDVVGAFPQIAEANVYGASVPHADGRCGCAAITFADGVSEENFDFAGLAEHAIKSLPRYAVPIFVRLTPKLDYTGTLKMQKGRLREEGMDVEKVEASGDRLYWLPPGGTKYVLFRVEDFGKIQKGEVKL